MYSHSEVCRRPGVGVWPRGAAPSPPHGTPGCKVGPGRGRVGAVHVPGSLCF